MQAINLTTDLEVIIHVTSPYFSAKEIMAWKNMWMTPMKVDTI